MQSTEGEMRPRLLILLQRRGSYKGRVRKKEKEKRSFAAVVAVRVRRDNLSFAIVQSVVGRRKKSLALSKSSEIKCAPWERHRGENVSFHPVAAAAFGLQKKRANFAAMER